MVHPKLTELTTLHDYLKARLTILKNIPVRLFNLLLRNLLNLITISVGVDSTS